MKVLFGSLFVSLISLSANAGSMYKVATCSAPMLEGEYTVYMSYDRESAMVSYSGVAKYQVTEFYLGPVSSYDFETASGLERIIIAVDGGHELQELNSRTGRFQKVADLTCNKGDME